MIAARRVEHTAELVLWEAERVTAKTTKGMKVPKKPLLALGDLSKAKPRPNANGLDPEVVETHLRQEVVVEKEPEAVGSKDEGSGGESNESNDNSDDGSNRS